MLRRQLRGGCGLLPVSVRHVLHWTNYSAKAIAQVQARGMPIDIAPWNLVQENKPAVIGELMRRFDPSYGDDEPIYTSEGEFSYVRSSTGSRARVSLFGRGLIVASSTYPATLLA